MTTSSIKRRRSPHDAPASNDGDDDDALEMENNDIEPQNNSSTTNRRSSRSSTTSSDGSVLASATSAAAAAAAAVSVSGDAADAADSINRISSNLGKRDSEEDSWASKGYSYINPFVHRIQIDSNIEVAKVSVLFLTSLPHYLIPHCSFSFCFPLTFPYAFIHAKQLKTAVGAGEWRVYLTLV